MTSPFVTDLQYVLHLVRGLLDQAEARLPKEIRLQHWMAAKGGPNGWATVQVQYPGRQDIQAAKTLTEICAQLEGLLADEQAWVKEDERLVKGLPKYDLSLKRMRGRP